MKDNEQDICRICKIKSPEAVVIVDEVREMLEKIIGAKVNLLGHLKISRYNL